MGKAAKKDRAIELDFLRGFSIFMMVLMHFAYDVRYEFGVRIFEFLRDPFFWSFVHPFFLVLFVGISGICCTFSRNNVTRGLKLLFVALLFTGGTVFATYVLNINCLIIFNVLHMLAVSILLFALIEKIEKKLKISEKLSTALMLFFGTLITAYGADIHYMNYQVENRLFYPLGFELNNPPDVADHMYIIPWLGVFFIGVVIGRICYSDRKTLIPRVSEFMRTKLKFITVPFEFLGRHSLIVYIVHQPIVYGILYVIFMFINKG